MNCFGKDIEVPEIQRNNTLRYNPFEYLLILEKSCQFVLAIVQFSLALLTNKIIHLALQWQGACSNSTIDFRN